MCYNSLIESSVLLIPKTDIYIPAGSLTFPVSQQADTIMVTEHKGLNMEVQNGPENFMGLPYALLFFRRFRYTDGRDDPDCRRPGSHGNLFY